MSNLTSIDKNYQPGMALVPTVVEKDGRSERMWDNFSLLLKNRIIFINEPITDILAGVVIAQLLYLESENPEATITININSPGGSVSAGFAIIDTMQKLSPTIDIVCMGMAASMGAMILMSATGRRMALENSTIMIHQPLGGAEGQASNIVIAANNIMKTRDRLYTIISDKTGKDFDQVVKDCDRDNYMTSQEALEYGIIDEIIVGARGKLIKNN